MTQYGENRRGDPTARQESVIAEAAAAQARFLEEEAPKVLNRPLGSRHVGVKEQLDDYLKVRNNPKALMVIRAEYDEQYGEDKGWVVFLNWAERNEERFNAQFKGEPIDIGPPLEVK